MFGIYILLCIKDWNISNYSTRQYVYSLQYSTVRLQFTVQYSVTTTKEMYVCASVSIDKRIDTNSDITHAHFTLDFMWKMVKFMRSQRFFVKQSTEVEKPSKSL